MKSGGRLNLGTILSVGPLAWSFPSLEARRAAEKVRKRVTGCGGLCR